MFNDFKNLHYDATKRKISKLFDIFQRLGLNSLEDRYNSLLEKFNSLGEQLDTLTKTITIKKEKDPFWPFEPPPPPPPSNLPDLIISGITPTVYSNYINFRITVQNIGTLTSSGTLVNVLIPTISSVTVAIPELAPSASFTTNTQYSFDPLGDPISITGLAEVNASHAIVESNYSNNRSSVLCDIKKAYIPDGIAYIIVHGHNPEGLEIGSIVYFDDDIVAYTPSQAAPYKHGQRHSVISGTYHVKAIFNGITSDLGIITIPADETIELVFPFLRTEALNFINYEETEVLTGFEQIKLSTNTEPIVLFAGPKNNPWLPPCLNARAEIAYLLNSVIFNLTLNGSIDYSPIGDRGVGLIIWRSGYSAIFAPITIFSNISFIYWYFQTKYLGDYPEIFLKDEFGGISLGGLLPADRDYLGIAANHSTVQIDLQSGNNLSESITLSGSAVIHLSSIPYDMDGTWI